QESAAIGGCFEVTCRYFGGRAGKRCENLRRCVSVVLAQERGGESFNTMEPNHLQEARPVNLGGNMADRLRPATEAPFAAFECQTELGSPAGSISCHAPSLPQRPDKANKGVMLDRVVTMSKTGLLQQLRRLSSAQRRLLLRASAL